MRIFLGMFGNFQHKPYSVCLRGSEGVFEVSAAGISKLLCKPGIFRGLTCRRQQHVACVNCVMHVEIRCACFQGFVLREVVLTRRTEQWSSSLVNVLKGT